MEEILEECKSIVDEVCEKYGYDSNDTPENESLKTVLLKAVPAMLVDSKQEDRELFYQMLKHTPIVVTENLTQEGLDELNKKYIGNVNPHIEQEIIDLGEYGNGVSSGAYVSEPIIGEDMQIKGKKSFLYIQKLINSEAKELLKTDINVSHLIHELGHAWHAEKDEYVMKDDNTLVERVGTAQFKYSFSPTKDGKFIKKNETATGLFIEEGMNTIEEEKAMANYMGISQEELQDIYDNNTFIKSDYQGLIKSFVQKLLDKTYKSDLENWRLHDDNSAKQRVEALIMKTEEWQNKDKMVTSDYDKKREIISQIDNPKVQEFFEKYESIYFPDISEITPLERIDNTLEQFYDLKDMKYSIDLSCYTELIYQIAYEFNPCINQAEEIKVKEEICRTTENVRTTEIQKVTQETKEGVESSQEKEENSKGDRDENE